jgi:uncharacterized membrane protein YeiH
MSPGLSEYVLLFQTVIQWIAIILSASTGVYEARRNGLDYFGALVIAVIVAVGGGTLRDLLLGRYPLFWLQDPIYLVSILVVGIIGIILVPVSARPLNGGRFRESEFFHGVLSLLFGTSGSFAVVDAIALGMWAYLGTSYALSSGIPPVITPIMGIITASFGGVLRDVFFAKIPEIFRPGEFYALASFAGAGSFVICWSAGLPDPAGFIACIVVTFLVRMISVKFNINTF